MMTEQDLAGFPRKGFTRNYTWRYHKDLGYGDHLERYGEVKDIETYCKEPTDPASGLNGCERKLKNHSGSCIP